MENLILNNFIVDHYFIPQSGTDCHFYTAHLSCYQWVPHDKRHGTPNCFPQIQIPEAFKISLLIKGLPGWQRRRQSCPHSGCKALLHVCPQECGASQGSNDGSTYNQDEKIVRKVNICTVWSRQLWRCKWLPFK